MNGISQTTSRSLWARAVGYMFLFGGTWFVALPIALLRAGSHTGIALRSPLSICAGAALIAAGSALSAVAAYYLVTVGNGTPFPLDPTRALVVGGPYARIRNPQAVATFLIVVGEAAILRSDALLWMLPLTIVYLEGLAAPFEHRELSRRYGGRYLEYRARVPKWLPLGWTAERSRRPSRS
jgi:protein-S-isoprenylcysteine O-methyltransferase Ste14